MGNTSVYKLSVEHLDMLIMTGHSLQHINSTTINLVQHLKITASI